MSGNDFVVVRSRGPASDLHERPVPDPATPAIWWHDVTSPALVLGSAQDQSVVDAAACRAAGVDVIRRRSGGGAVLLLPGEVVWFDVIVPLAGTGGPGHGPMSDIRRSMVWLGERLRDVMGRGTVHDGPLVATPWSRTICFDGIGPGELVVDGAKLVGISQRRTRHAARFQVCAHTSYDPSALPALLRPGHRPPTDVLRPVALIDDATAGTLPELLRTTLTTTLTTTPTT